MTLTQLELEQRRIAKRKLVGRDQLIHELFKRLNAKYSEAVLERHWFAAAGLTI